MTTQWTAEEMAALDAVIAEYTQRIADRKAEIEALKAEIERLRAEQWTPVEDGEYRCECDPACTSLLQIASDADSDSMAVWMRDEDQIGLVHLHGLRLCKRGAA